MRCIFFRKMGEEDLFERNDAEFNIDSLLQAYQLLINALQRYLGNKRFYCIKINFYVKLILRFLCGHPWCTYGLGTKGIGQI